MPKMFFKLDIEFMNGELRSLTGNSEGPNVSFSEHIRGIEEGHARGDFYDLPQYSFPHSEIKRIHIERA